MLEFYATEALAPHPALLEAMTQIGIQLGRAFERERAATQAQRQQEALLQQEKLAAMSTMLASVAHELNNPLATILLQADVGGRRPGRPAGRARYRDRSGGGALRAPGAAVSHSGPPAPAGARRGGAQHAGGGHCGAASLSLPGRQRGGAPVPGRPAPSPLGRSASTATGLINLLTNAQQALRAAPGAREVTSPHSTARRSTRSRS